MVLRKFIRRSLVVGEIVVEEEIFSDIALEIGFGISGRHFVPEVFRIGEFG